jgi:nucleotide-binding universal stress UspA family protein
MKKILLAVAENKLPEDAFEFIRQLNEINPVLVTGVFLREIIYITEPAISYYGGSGVPVYSAETEAYSREEIKKRIDWFETACQKNNIEYRVHDDTDDLIVHELVKETRFADLLVVSAEVFYQISEIAEPEGYFKSILHLAECPVLIVPQKFSFPQNSVLTYDGSESSVYAIKQFAYVLNEFCNKEAVVVFESSEEETMPDEVLIHELAARHFNALTFLMLSKDRFRLSEWAKAKHSPILVTGSYSRSDFSEIFRKSFVSAIIRDHKMPVFIAHK